MSLFPELVTRDQLGEGVRRPRNWSRSGQNDRSVWRSHVEALHHTAKVRFGPNITVINGVSVHLDASIGQEQDQAATRTAL